MPEVMKSGALVFEPEKVTASGKVTNEFTGAVQRLKSFRAQYRVQWTFRSFKNSEEPEVLEFINKIDPAENVFRAPMPGMIRRGKGKGEITLNGNHQVYSKTIKLKGYTPNVLASVCAGDPIEIGRHGCIVTSTSSSDSNGELEVSIFPPLPRSMSEGDKVEVIKPHFIWCLESAPGWSMTGANQRRITTSFSAITEVLHEGHELL